VDFQHLLVCGLRAVFGCFVKGRMKKTRGGGLFESCGPAWARGSSRRGDRSCDTVLYWCDYSYYWISVNTEKIPMWGYGGDGGDGAGVNAEFRVRNGERAEQPRIARCLRKEGWRSEGDRSEWVNREREQERGPFIASGAEFGMATI